jgi:hypothetical protein
VAFPVLGKNSEKTKESKQAAEKGGCPWFDRLTMRCNALIIHSLILSLSKDGAKNPAFSAAC